MNVEPWQQGVPQTQYTQITLKDLFHPVPDEVVHRVSPRQIDDYILGHLALSSKWVKALKKELQTFRDLHMEVPVFQADGKKGTTEESLRMNQLVRDLSLADNHYTPPGATSSSSSHPASYIFDTKNYPKSHESITVEGKTYTPQITKEKPTYIGHRQVTKSKTPSEIEFVESLPLGPSGKILKRKLR